MTYIDLEQWMESMGFNKIQASAAIGISRPTLDRYLSGKSPIPLNIALACAAVAAGLGPYKTPRKR